jgi:hypothetical protein
MRKLSINFVLVTIVTAAMAVVTASIARAAEDQVVVRVPFSFIVGDTRLPAGAYIVKEMSEDLSVVSIASMDGRHSVLTMTIALPGDEAAVQPEVVFEKFGGQYFLARVLGDDGFGRAIPLTQARMEHELEKISQNR